MSFYTRKSENYESQQSEYVAQPPELEIAFPNRAEIGTLRYEWSSAQIQSQLPIDILQIAVKDHEFNGCYSHMKLKQRQVLRSWCDNVGYVDFGEFGNHKVKVALIKSTMGSIPALLAVTNAVEILKPRVVLFVGFCASVNPAKAKLGDVVISAKLATYSSKKITEDGTEELRGIKGHISRNMSRLILSADQGWQPPLKDESQSLSIKVHKQAVMLSGPELVDNRERREQLLRYYPDAIALDMEGEGLYAAAYDLGIEWAVIKGVSDFADGSKKATGNWQPFASAMAASVVYNMFQYPDVLRQWPHYEKIAPGLSDAGARSVATAPQPLHQHERRPVVHKSIDEFIQRANFGDSGQFKYKDRWITYNVDKRFPSLLSESWSWKYDGTATDKATGIRVKRGNFLEASKAAKYTVKALLEKLQEVKLLD